MSSERYERVDYTAIQDVQLQSSSDSASGSGSSSRTDPDRMAAQEAHPTAFRKFAIQYDVLIEAIEERDREEVFDVLGLPNPYNRKSESARPRFSGEFRNSLPDTFLKNIECEAAPDYGFEGLFTGVSWGGRYRYESASQFALRLAWMMHVPTESDAIREYHDGRAEAYLRDLNAEYAPAAAGSRGNQFEERVQEFLQACGLPLGPRQFRVEMSDGTVRRELDINTELDGEAVILEVYTDMSSYVNKDDQVRDYARLYSLIENSRELPHACELTDTKQSRIHLELIELLLNEEVDRLPPLLNSARNSSTTYEINRETSSEYESLPPEVVSHEASVIELLDTQDVEWTTPMLSVTRSQSSSGRYNLGRTQSSSETRHIPLGPTIEHGTTVVSFLSGRRVEELCLSKWESGVKTSGGSKFYPVIVPDGKYVRGQSIPVVDPAVLGVLLGPGLSGVQAPF